MQDTQETDPWVGKVPWGGNGNPPQCSRWENPMDRGAWWATVHGAAKESDTAEPLTLSLFQNEVTRLGPDPTGLGSS